MQTGAVNLDQPPDDGRWSWRQRGLVAVTALTIIFDGADIQLLGIAIPSMMSDWSVPRAAFAPVLAAGLVGMMIGGAIGGVIGDRFGRRIALIGSLLVFGVLTLAATAADGLLSLGVLRFLAGLGFGGTVPTAATLVSEYAPRRHRAFAVTLTILCVPIGGTLAALVASAVLPAFGWRALFVVGGVSPILMAVVLFFALPESPGYLASAPARWGEPLRFLFSADYRRDTCALFIAFASCLLAVYLGFNWIPAMLTGAGIDVATASTGLAAFNLGGVAGAIAAAMIIVRIGSRSTIMGMAVAAGLSAAAMSAMPITPGAAGSAVLMLGLTGGLINAVQITMYALAAHVYPVAVRATGVGSAASVGRLGAVFSTYAGAWALERGGTSLFFIVVAAAMAVVLVSLGMVSRHIPAEAATGASPSSSLRSRR